MTVDVVRPPWAPHEEIVRRGDVLDIDLWFPRLEHEQIKAVQVGLVDVRAADAIRISYDFDRDGWVIKQASIFEFAVDDEEMDMDWQEVAFVKAWGRDRAVLR